MKKTIQENGIEKSGDHPRPIFEGLNFLGSFFELSEFRFGPFLAISRLLHLKHDFAWFDGSLHTKRKLWNSSETHFSVMFARSVKHFELFESY